MPRNRVLAYDPGGTTGFAELYLDSDLNQIRLVNIGEFNGWSLLPAHLHRGEKQSSGLIVVYEKFSYTTTFVNPIAIEVIGVMKVLCQMNEVPMVGQTPQKRYFVDKRWPGRFDQFKSHEGDALRHGLVYAYHDLAFRDFTFEIPAQDLISSL